MKINQLSCLVFAFALVVSLGCASGQPLKRAGTATQARTINFIENNWAATRKKAVAENKYIFVDAYAIWCGPCKMLKATTFNDPQAASYFNKRFVNAALDMEKGDGTSLAADWGIEAYPTLIILDTKGRLVRKAAGFMDAKELIRFGQLALDQKSH